MSANLDDLILDRDPLGLRLAQAQVPAPDSHLRAALVAKHKNKTGLRHPLRWATAVGLAVTLFLAFATPVGAIAERALLPTWLQQRLGIVGASEQLSSRNKFGAVPGVRISPLPCSQASRLRSNALCYPDLSLADAQRQVDFTIPVPASIPNGLSFGGALVESPHSVRLVMRDQTAQRALGLWIRKAPTSGGSAFPLSSTQTTQVQGTTAVYVHGSYEDSGPGTAARWNPTADDQELIWSHNGFAYDLTAHGLHLSLQGFIHIAESIP